MPPCKGHRRVAPPSPDLFPFIVFVCVCAKTRLRVRRVFCRLNCGFAKSPDMAEQDELPPVRLPITGELDLHTFRPAEAAALLEDYFTECRRLGLSRVRVVHGKGTGTLRATVLACLRRSAQVADFASGNETTGGWGATVVTLKPLDSS